MSGHRVHEPQCPGMEGLAGEDLKKSLHLRFLPGGAGAPGDLPAAVGRIAEYRVVHVREVDADLVCPSRAELQTEKGKIGEPFQDGVLGDRGLSVGHDRHFLPIGLASSELSLDDPPLLLEEAPDDRLVLPIDRPPGELPGKVGVRGIAFRDHEQARGVFVEPVHDSRPGRIVGGREVTVIEKGIDQGTRVISVGGMDNHAGRLVHDQEVFVLIHDGKRDVFRRYFRRPGSRKHDVDQLSGTHLMTRPHLLPVHQDRPGADGLLDLRPRGVLDVPGQEEIEPLLLFPRRDNNIKGSIQG